MNRGSHSQSLLLPSFFDNYIYMQVLKFCDSSNLTKAFLLSEKLSLLICTGNAKNV